MKRIIATCFIAILCASQASAETFRSSSDNQPRFKADKAPAAAKKTLYGENCKYFDTINTTANSSTLFVTGTCHDDGSLWVNQRALTVGSGAWIGWKKVSMDVYPEETEVE